jgi:hypothetical protein
MKLGFKSARQEKEANDGGAHEVGRISDVVVVQVEASSTECHVQSKPPLINMRGFTGKRFHNGVSETDLKLKERCIFAGHVAKTI